MNRKVIYLINIPSSILLLLSIAPGQVAGMVLAIVAGLVLGTGECIYLYKKNPPPNKYLMSISLIVGCMVCFLAAVSFYQIWIPSGDLMGTLVTKVFSDYSTGLLVMSVLIGILSVPSATCLAGLLLLGLTHFIDCKKIWEDLLGLVAGFSGLRRAGLVIAQIAIAALCGTVLLYGVYLLPVEPISEHVGASAYTFREEGTYPKLSERFTSRLDNFTDAIILLEAADDSAQSALTGAMNAARGSIPEHNPVESMVSHYIDGEEFTNHLTYRRYWHGFLVFLKPLFEVFEYNTIRIINGIVQGILVLLTCALLFRKGQRAAVIPYLLSWCMLMPLALAKSFQFSSCFYVFTLGGIALLLTDGDGRKDKAPAVFLWCGILTAYFDFLTYPISTFGVPMAFYLLLRGSDPAEKKIFAMIRNGFNWGVGFGGMWVTKWLIGSVITGQNVIMEGVERVAVRTATTSVDGAVDYGLLSCEHDNFKAFLTTPFTYCAGLCILYLLWRCIRKNKNSLKETGRILFPFVLTALAPVVWYAFAINHSTIHFWFTNKACVVTLVAILFGLVCLPQAGKQSRADL